MITKDKLLHSLKKSLRTEEMAIPVYTKHLESTVFLSGMPHEDEKRIEETLLMLGRESEIHKKIFQSLIQEVEKSSQHVY
jgi:rubrerythrin